jgi:hypothetical protein
MKDSLDANGFVLTNDNYYSKEADRAYYSCSQIDSFRECEAKAMASLEGRYERKTGDAFLVGQYFHAAMESDEAFKEFCDAHFDEIFKTKETKARGFEITGKYAKFADADNWVSVAKADPVFNKFREMDGENEVSFSGTLFDLYPWKVRFDRYIHNPRSILDWKTTANIRETFYDPEQGKRVSFVEYYGYYTRAAVYLEIERQNSGFDTDAAFYLACVSKQDPPGKELLTFSNALDRQKMDVALDNLRRDMVRIDRVKSGYAKPKRCEECDYCRATKKITGIMNVWQLDPGERPERPDDYAMETVQDGIHSEA